MNATEWDADIGRSIKEYWNEAYGSPEYKRKKKEYWG